MEEQERLEGALARRGGMARVELMERGSRERLLELARAYSERKYGKGRGTVLSAEEATEPGIRRVKPERSRVEEAGGFDVCALLLPSYEPGAPAYGPGFGRDMAILCAERDWLLLLDETATAPGKTGRLFGYQHMGVLPDGAFFEGGVLIGDKLAGCGAEPAAGKISPEKWMERLAELVEHYP